MNRLLSILTLIIFSYISYGQSKSDYGCDLYVQGTELLKIGKYNEANQKFSEALCTYQNADIYYNRSIAKLMQSDTAGFCDDIGIASYRYTDTEATEMYLKNCFISVDTTFYDKKRKPTTNDNYRYYEIVKKFKYKNKILGTYHDKKQITKELAADYNCEKSIIGLYSITTDKLAVYEVVDSVKHYYYTRNKSTFMIADYQKKVKAKGSKLLLDKFGYIKADCEVDTIKVFFKTLVNTQGEIEFLEYIKFDPEVSITYDSNELEAMLAEIVKDYPRVLPAKFFNEKICAVIIDHIEF